VDKIRVDKAARAAAKVAKETKAALSKKYRYLSHKAKKPKQPGSRNPGTVLSKKGILVHTSPVDKVSALSKQFRDPKKVRSRAPCTVITYQNGKPITTKVI
jgi:hypothetical protein